MSTSASTDTEFPPEATQTLAWEIFGPLTTGWILQICISGACLQKATDLYSKYSLLTRPMRIVLSSVLILNTLDLINTIAQLLMRAADQNRDTATMGQYLVPDSYQPILAGSVAAIVQSYFANRAWKICNKNIFFLILIATFITASLVGSIALGIVQILNMNGATAWDLLLIFIEMWTWTAVVTDVTVSLVIIVGLVSKKTGHDMPTDSLVMKIVYTAMQSASITSVFATSAAIIYAIQWNMANGAVVIVFLYALPSLYTYSVLWCLACTTHVREQHKSRVERGGHSFSITPGNTSGITTSGVTTGNNSWGDNAVKFDFSDVVADGINTDFAHTMLDGNDFKNRAPDDGEKAIDNIWASVGRQRSAVPV